LKQLSALANAAKGRRRCRRRRGSKAPPDRPETLSDAIISPGERRGLFATPSYVRLWFAGGVGNAMRWLELLVAGVFTYEATHSTFLVAVVTVARSLPMLFVGALAGVVGEALNRKRLLVAQLLVMTGTSAALCALALCGRVMVWHVVTAGFVNGMVWAMELAVRRRMIGEVVAIDQIAPAVAFDSLTNSVARVLGRSPAVPLSSPWALPAPISSRRRFTSRRASSSADWIFGKSLDRCASTALAPTSPKG
jgi:MFS family permease